MTTTHSDQALLDARFQEAVAAIDAGDLVRLRQLLDATPVLVRDRLELPGGWLTDRIGNAATGFFARPYLLWFVAEDPVRNGTLPSNIGDVARTIISAARANGADHLQDQLDYALSLVSWSWIARQCDVQIELIDVLVDAGAALNGNQNNALVNGNVAAAEHLVKRGAALTLEVALMLERWSEAEVLLRDSSSDNLQFALVLLALNGRAEAARRLIAAGANPNVPSTGLYSHGTPLHHAVSSGRLDVVRVMVDAGADAKLKDSAWGGTPLGWAHHYLDEGPDAHPGKEYREIAEYLDGKDRDGRHYNG